MKHTISILPLFLFTLTIIGQVLPEAEKQNPYANETVYNHTESAIIQDLGFKVIDLTENEKVSLHLSGGVKVVEIYSNKTGHITQMRIGFIILKTNNIPISSKQQFHEILSRQNECSVVLEGIYAGSATSYYYAFELD